MSSESGRILRSRAVVPVVEPPIDDGAVFFSEGIIRQVGRFRDLKDLSSDVEDLGEGVLCPGLVNAHCHLDFTELGGKIPPPDSFASWVRSILMRSSEWTPHEWISSWNKGLDQLVRNGVTTVLNIETSLNYLSLLRQELPIRVHSFLEMTGLIAGAQAVELVDAALRLRAELGGEIGLAPHSVYAAAQGLMRTVAHAMEEHDVRSTIHLAESLDEHLMFTESRGALYETLYGFGRGMSDCGKGSPVALAARSGMLRRETVVAHANYLSEADVELLAESGASVVHCPSCHAYFGHVPFPFEELRAAGVNLCLGTDSLASVLPDEDGCFELNLFTEMRRFSNREQGVDPSEVLKMATLHGARALGVGEKAGGLGEGFLADAVWMAGKPRLRDVESWLVNEVKRPDEVMVDGEWIEEAIE